MKKRNMITTMVVVIVAIAVMASAFLMMRHVEPTERHKISVILNKSSDSRWTSLIAGLREAAMENDVNLNIVTTDLMDSLEQEIEIASREINAGAQGVIIDLAGAESIDELVARFSHLVPLEIIDSGEYSGYGENNIASIYTDDTEVGQTLCNVLLEQDDVVNIGILAGTLGQSVSTRLSSLLSACRENGIFVKWVKVDEDMDVAGLDAIIALENGALEKAGDALASVQQHIFLIGYGNSKKNIYYLDNGVIDAMIVPHEFQMGYLALVDVLDRIENPTASMSSKIVDTVVVERDMIFTSEMETLLFPITR